MERKGSGFGKIISGYEFQINYSESKRQTFRSDRYQFTVVMQNLNYGVTQDVTQDKLDAKILDLIRKDGKISTEKMAIALGVSTITIKREFVLKTPFVVINVDDDYYKKASYWFMSIR